tara:strand:+ start:219 stop:572 length:354 start_codon:yes stop_codon:yes gene_type:complete
MGCIYLLYNEAGYGYIGQTKNIKRRLREHKKKTEHSHSKMLGEWECEVLEECENDCLLDYEKYWYDFYNELFPYMLVNKIIPLQKNTPERVINRAKKWYENNKERSKENQRRRRSKK